MPNLILSGPPGTGKTTSVLALARTMLGDAFKEAVLELNASDDRGIEVVRGRIKAFAQKKVTLPPGKHKIIILDEADSLTADAQAALRRTMETYSRVTRFCIICNYISRIIDPLASRCTKFRFKPLAREAMVARLSEIAAAEGVRGALRVARAPRAVDRGTKRLPAPLSVPGCSSEGGTTLTRSTLSYIR
jgi:replication factor C subunit 2/4